MVGSKTAYFKHLARLTNQQNEREEHALSKKLLQLALTEAHFAAAIEVTLAAGQLRSDIRASSNLAFEIQCAPLSQAEFQHRHNLYKKSGVLDIWLVGQQHYLRHQLKKTQLIYFRTNQLWQDYYLEIAPFQRCIRLKYNVMLEPLTNRLHYQLATFSLSGQGLTKLWQFKPKLKGYSVNPLAQKQYLTRQITQKSLKGLEIASKLYQMQLTVDDLPQWVFRRLRRVTATDNAASYFRLSADD
ncbi:competence protein [Lactobacillus xylocopicola]|uniref:Competence protein n=1 Tax=Lactobacillus xylocopicola TaxID=2976676 RepID=A0ABN6SMC7_9LACO|nr:competence protein [Lactobacillus xylocopicola]